MTNSIQKYFYSHGKLLLTGEYFVLDGASALAIPTRRGQDLTVIADEKGPPQVIWESYTSQGTLWFEGIFDLRSGKYLSGSDLQIGKRLQDLFVAGAHLNPKLGRDGAPHGYRVRTALEFPTNWGLGTSSTLVANLASWWQVDPYQLLEKTFGGSGYDLACARANGAILYQIRNGKPQVSAVDFRPSFHENLQFLFLEEKQNSRSGIAQYRTCGVIDPSTLAAVSRLSQEAVKITNLSAFCELMKIHETLVGQQLGLIPIKQRLFSDFPGMIKSLGAWGGDFVLVASELPLDAVRAYFAVRGYPTLLTFRDMILAPN